MYWRRVIDWPAVCRCGRISLPAPSINPHFSRLLRFNSHLSIESRAKRHTRILIVSSGTRCPHTHFTPFCGLCVLLRVLSGGLASRCDFRDVFCQLAVRAQRVSPQHKGKVRGQKTVTAGDLGSKSIVKPCTVFSASWQRDTFNHIRSNNDLSLAATYPHAPRSQQHGSGTPWVGKCPLWKLQRQSAHSLTTTALVL